MRLVRYLICSLICRILRSRLLPVRPVAAASTRADQGLVNDDVARRSWMMAGIGPGDFLSGRIGTSRRAPVSRTGPSAAVLDATRLQICPARWLRTVSTREERT